MHLELRIVRAGAQDYDAPQRPLPDGALGTEITLREMSRLVLADSRSEEVDRFVKSDLLRDARPHDDADELRHLLDYWQNRIRWRRDARGIERIADTLTTRRLGWGDCGDKSIGLAASIAIIGHTPYFVVISQSGVLPDGSFDWQHVYVGVRHKGQHFGLDPTPENRAPGWEPKHTARFGWRIFPEAGKPRVWVIR